MSGARNGFYTKTGRSVTIMIALDGTSMAGTAGGLKIGGLPFASSSATGYESTGSCMHTAMNIGGYTQVTTYLGTGTSALDLFLSKDSTAWSTVAVQGGWSIRLSHTYFTDA
jgi:hypothetical protein